METRMRIWPSFQRLAIVSLLLATLGGCAAIEKGGAYTRVSGEAMTDYSKRNEGFVGTMAGIGGTVNTAVGGAIENAAKGSSGSSPDAASSANAPAGSTPGATPTSAPPAAAKPAPAMSIADAQKRLLALGYQPGASDGVMNKKTVDALKAFQKDQKLPVTGELSQDTIARLRNARRAG